MTIKPKITICMMLIIFALSEAIHAYCPKCEAVITDINTSELEESNGER